MKGQVKVIAVGKERKGSETHVHLVFTDCWGRRWEWAREKKESRRTFRFCAYASGWMARPSSETENKG